MPRFLATNTPKFAAVIPCCAIAILHCALDMPISSSVLCIFAQLVLFFASFIPNDAMCIPLLAYNILTYAA